MTDLIAIARESQNCQRQKKGSNGLLRTMRAKGNTKRNQGAESLLIIVVSKGDIADLLGLATRLVRMPEEERHGKASILGGEEQEIVHLLDDLQDLEWEDELTDPKISSSSFSWWLAMLSS